LAKAEASSGPDTISFAGVAAGSVLKIEEVDLPTIFDQVTIDGSTAAGAVPGKPAIELEPVNFTGEAFAGLSVNFGDGTRIEGLAIGGFVSGIAIGPEETGNPSGTLICGDYLGVALDGVTPRPNLAGVEIERGPEATTIGGDAGCPGNLISGNSRFGVSDAGTGTRVGANRIGLDANGGPMPNGTSDGFAAGVFEDGNAAGAVITGNTIAANRGSGVEVELGGSGVEVRRNSIFENELHGITVLNEAPAAPTITSVTSPAPMVTRIEGTLEGLEPGESADLDFYASSATCATGQAQGETYLGSGAVVGGGVGYSTELPVEVPAGETGITATLTRTEGVPNHATSEFSNCATYSPPPAPPATTIVSAPSVSSEATQATFEFAAAGPNAVGFECSFDIGTFTPCTSPQSFSGLAPGTHTFAVRTVGAGARTGAPSVYEWTVMAPLPPPPTERTEQSNSNPPATASVAAPTGPGPTNGEKVVIEPVEGKIRVRLPGTDKYVSILTLTEIPVGAVIDATRGKVTLTSIGPNGEEQTADFFAGVFRVKQKEGSGLVVLELLDTNVCRAPKKGGKGRGAEASAVRARPAGGGSSGKLWGSGHGNFRTEGNNGSATVRGTIWLVEDRCNGTTFFRTRRGVVSVRDFILHKTLPLPAGKTYVAGEG
jgi:hypothetical protein